MRVPSLVLTSLVLPLSSVALLTSCAAMPAMSVPMEPLAIAQAPAPLVDHFERDKSSAIGEDAIRAILDAPVFLEERARLGVVRVSDGYRADGSLPLATVPGELGEALETSGHFDVVTEVSTDWPTDTGVAGLRELAARYRCEYLLLYRHRFVDREWTNGWGAMWLTVIGGFMVPESTIEVAGAMEATLFDVKTGTLLFTVFDRVNKRSNEFIYAHDRIVRDLQTELLAEGARRLSDQVVGKVQRLAQARSRLLPRVSEAQPTP